MEKEGRQKGGRQKGRKAGRKEEGKEEGHEAWVLRSEKGAEVLLAIVDNLIPPAKEVELFPVDNGLSLKGSRR